MTRTGRLHDALSTVCPIRGVSVGRWDDRSTWRVDCASEATELQRTAMQHLLESIPLGDLAPLREDARGERYRREADPLLLAVMGYDLELEQLPLGEERTATQAKRAQAKSDYLAAKTRIRTEVR